MLVGFIKPEWTVSQKTVMKFCKHLPNLNHLILSLTVSRIYLKSISHSGKKKKKKQQKALNCRRFSDGGGLEIYTYSSSTGTSLLLPNCLQVLLWGYKALAVISAALPERKASADKCFCANLRPHRLLFKIVEKYATYSIELLRESGVAVSRFS